MGEYLLLKWLSTRRGLIVFGLLYLMTAVSNVCRLASDKSREPALVKGNHKTERLVQTSKK